MAECLEVQAAHKAHEHFKGQQCFRSVAFQAHLFEAVTAPLLCKPHRVYIFQNAYAVPPD